MTSALVATYARERNYAVGHCTECGCAAMAPPGYPRQFHHVDRRGGIVPPLHRYNWFHTPVRVSRSAVVGLARRIVFTVTYPWRRWAFARKVKRASWWPEG